jgi:hypothetical protein
VTPELQQELATNQMAVEEIVFKSNGILVADMQFLTVSVLAFLRLSAYLNQEQYGNSSFYGKRGGTHENGII